ncbi:MAG: YiiX family permuted papain-like enzyme [Bacteroidia bacterium]
MRRLFIFLGIIFCSFLYAQQTAVKDGDIIFIMNPGGQGKAIQLATKSKYTHVGIVFHENGKPMVYHAVEPVSVNSLEEFISMSSDGKYEIKRLKDDKVLDAETISKMLKYAKSLLGVHYDIYFAWDDKQLYCSEFVWKLFNKYTHLEVGKPRPLKEFDLSNPVVKEIMKSRYGNNIPYNEKMISPGDMFDSELLK